MTNPEVASSPPPAANAVGWRPYVTFLLPFVLYMAIGSLEPAPPNDPAAAAAAAEARADWWWSIPYHYYPVVYTLKLGVVLACVILVSPGYRSLLPLRLSWLAVGVGAVGAVVWIGLAELQRPLNESLAWSMLQRSAFDPLKVLAEWPALAYGFLAIRFLGLVVVVPIIEEMFLRGFVMRYVTDDRAWHRLPLTAMSTAAVAVGTLLPVLLHPGEAFAAAVWFSLVTWLMLRTGSIWNCIAAHALTNLLLGIYVMTTGRWFLM